MIDKGYLWSNAQHLSFLDLIKVKVSLLSPSAVDNRGIRRRYNDLLEIEA